MANSETCSRCNQEVRWGWRDGVEGYWHRESVEHVPIFGRSVTRDEVDEIDRRYREEIHFDDDGKPYTAAEYDILRDKNLERRKHRLADFHGVDPDYVEPLPDPEVICHPVEPDSFAPRSGIRQVINLVLKSGWELRRLTHARGPYLGADGSVLSISDSIVVGARGPALDGQIPYAVGSWRDGKFDYSFTGILGGATTRVDNTTMKNWIKEHTA